MSVEIIAAFFAGLVALITAIAAAVISVKNSKQLQAIHVLVNSRLTTALEEIVTLRSEVTKLTNGKK